MHFLEGTFTDGLALVKPLEKKLKAYNLYLDQHHVLLFYYKIACLYFGSGDYGNTIEYLNKIINLKVGNLRGDIQCYARILHLIAHYELGHFNLLEYLVKSVYRFLAKMEDLNQVQQEMLKFLRSAMNKNPRDLRDSFLQLKNKLDKISFDSFESRSFLYLDLVSWLESKIEAKSVQEVIRGKFLQGMR